MRCGAVCCGVLRCVTCHSWTRLTYPRSRWLTDQLLHNSATGSSQEPEPEAAVTESGGEGRPGMGASAERKGEQEGEGAVYSAQ